MLDPVVKTNLIQDTLPIGWVETTLEQVAEVTNGYAFKGDELGEFVTGLLPVFKMGNISRGGGLKWTGKEDYYQGDYNLINKRFRTQKNDILMSMTDMQASMELLGYSARIENEDFLVNQRVGIIRPIENKVFPKYLSYFMNTKYYIDNVRTKANSGVQVNLTTAGIKQSPIILPSLPEQKAIASLLSSFDDKIGLLREQNRTLEQTAQTIFHEWFGKYSIEDELPEGWKVYEFKEIVKQIKPGTNYQPDRVERGIPFVSGRNVQDGFIDLSDVQYITNEEYLRVHNTWRPEENDILITRIGTLGNVGVVNKENLPIAVHYNSIDIKSSITSFQFIYFLLKSEYFSYFYHLRKKQAVQEYITIEDVESIPIILPDNISKLNKSEIIFIELFNKLRANYQQIQSLSKTRDELLPRLMRSEVRIKF